MQKNIQLSTFSSKETDLQIYITVIIHLFINKKILQKPKKDNKTHFFPESIYSFNVFYYFVILSFVVDAFPVHFGDIPFRGNKKAPFQEEGGFFVAAKSGDQIISTQPCWSGTLPY